MTTMLYFHGYAGGIDKTGGTLEYVRTMNLADEIIAFNAPFPVDGGGYKWFSLPEYGVGDTPNFDSEIKKACEIILEKIRGKKIDLIFGASQGGFMALYLTLNNIIKCDRAIAAVPFYVDKLARDIKNKTTPILWIAGGQDEMIPSDVGNVWRDLQSSGANLDFRWDAESAHRPDTWTQNFIEQIKKWSKAK